MNECGCKIIGYDMYRKIDFCPLHQHAKELLKSLRELTSQIPIKHPRTRQDVIDDAIKTIAKATEGQR